MTHADGAVPSWITFDAASGKLTVNTNAPPNYAESVDGKLTISGTGDQTLPPPPANTDGSPGPPHPDAVTNEVGLIIEEAKCDATQALEASAGTE